MHHSSRSPYITLIATYITVLCLAGIGLAQEEPDTTTIEINGKMHSPSELMRLIEQSALVYEMGEDTTLSSRKPSREVFVSPYYIDSSTGEWELRQYTIGDSVNQALAISDGAFAAEDYQSALELYKEVYELDPSVDHILTLIGNSYYMLGDYKSAVYCLELAIDSNFYDCWAHWFLADAVWRRGDSARAVKEITIAHLLNRNHEKLFERMVEYRNATGAGWDAWTFDPVYEISRDTSDEHRINVRGEADWAIYALVKAFWKFEPDYARTMWDSIPSEYDRVMIEEREATVCQMLAREEKYSEDYIIELLDNNMLDYFIIYEITSRANPDLFYRSTPSTLETFAKYLDLYH